MSHRSYRVQALLVCLAMPIVACHRHRLNTPPAPMAWPTEEHCWWAAFRTTMSPDSVALRFESALQAIGFTHALAGSLADTAWAQAGPTVLATKKQAGNYAARVVAIRMGDSTRFRPFVGADTADGRLISMCADIMRGAALHATAPREQEPDDSMPRWRRRP